MFHFVASEDLETAEGKTERRKIRQHAIRNGIRNKKRGLVQRNANFVIVNIDANTGKPTRGNQKTDSTPLNKALAGEQLDPFGTLPGDGEELRMLIRHRATSSLEPAFCVDEAKTVCLNGMDNIFKNTSSNPALFEALSLVLTLAANRNVPNLRCLEFRGATLHNLRGRMGNIHRVPSVSTLTAMLLLIGYEYNVDSSNTRSINLHVRAVQDVLGLLANNVLVSEVLQHALFWQDLYSCAFLGTKRLFSHHDYRIHDGSNKRFETNQFSNFSSLSSPLGFSILVHESSEFGLILKNLSALCNKVDYHCTLEISYIQEMLQEDQCVLTSRTVDVLDEARKMGSGDRIYEACIIATLLCLYKFSTGIWEGCFMPEYFATQVMGLMLQARYDSRLREWPELLLWLLIVSGALSKELAVKKKAMRLIRFDFREQLDGMFEDWEHLMLSMRKFIWCRTSMGEPVRLFLEELHQQKL
ncbi:hypothetical protein P280DRAFT_470969 [Massarina eburnea CBS 473.64]|uniref:Transcription factor domain-containing protein n=1 Tax=Massarina eburnea CBS 473.64 TaxID=1395130 RepID=A0A6A6RUV6_9PLEO|nr:hypothetical protein P280DRAFT_470969 [Massarina eburnea CBS 473.64]